MVRILSIEKSQTVAITPGTIVSMGANFCYVIAHSSTFRRDSNAYYEVVFPDTNRTTVGLDISSVATCNDIAAFFIFNAPFYISMVYPVQFCEHEASKHQVVYTLGFDQDINYPSYLSDGSVNFVGTTQFIHDCCPDYFTVFGSPVFDADGYLVGLCSRDRGVLITYNLESIAELISIINKREKQSIGDLLEYIEGQGQAGSQVHWF